MSDAYFWHSFQKYSQMNTMARVSSSQYVNRAFLRASDMVLSENCIFAYAARAAPPLAMDSVSFSSKSSGSKSTSRYVEIGGSSLYGLITTPSSPYLIHTLGSVRLALGILSVPYMASEYFSFMKSDAFYTDGSTTFIE